MTTEIDHSKLIKKIAKERLKPFDIFQKGQSRTFLYDKGWFTILIEFQPSAWSKGTGLNIGVDLNLYPRDYFAFIYGYRETNVVEFEDEVTLTKKINELCDHAIITVKELVNLFLDLWTAIETNEKIESKDTWKLFELGVLFGLISDYNKARQLLNQVIEEKCEFEWQLQRQRITAEILIWLEEEVTFTDKIKEMINTTRQMKKLPIIDLNDLTERKIYR
jgi:hypothetical protein